MTNQPISQQIDAIINLHDGWKADALSQIRSVVTQAHPSIEEEVKWKTASRPEGLPVWSSSGIVCFAEIWKDNVKLIFFKGSQIQDTDQLFNARLKSSSVRAIELRENYHVDELAIADLVRQGVAINQSAKSTT